MSDARRRTVLVQPRKPPTELRAVRAVVRKDPNPDTSYLHDEGFEDLLAAYKRGRLQFVLLQLEAETTIAGTPQRLLGQELGGIENDIEDEELMELVREEWKSLRTVLKTIGVPTEQLPVEADANWVEWRV